MDEELVCDFIAGCDGYHGPSRKAIPDTIRKEHLHMYKDGWLGILSDSAPAADELVYANHDKGFALLSTRTPILQRHYLQVDANDDIANWSDDPGWTELNERTKTHDGWQIPDGPINSKGIIQMRSFICETMPNMAASLSQVMPLIPFHLQERKDLIWLLQMSKSWLVELPNSIKLAATIY